MILIIISRWLEATVRCQGLQLWKIFWNRKTMLLLFPIYFLPIKRLLLMQVWKKWFSVSLWRKQTKLPLFFWIHIVRLLWIIYGFQQLKKKSEKIILLFLHQQSKSCQSIFWLLNLLNLRNLVARRKLIPISMSSLNIILWFVHLAGKISFSYFRKFLLTSKCILRRERFLNF